MSTSRITRPVLRYHGGKWKLAPWIISHFPKHQIYVESFGGGGSVLISKERSYAEIYNDLDLEIVNLFRVVRDQGPKLIRAIELTPYAREEFNASFRPSCRPLEQARRTVLRSYAGFGGNLTRITRDLTPQRTGFRDYSKKNRHAIPAQDWRNWPGALPNLIDRLRGVIIENRDAIRIITKHDSPETLHYVDPPYVHTTRRFDGNGHRGHRHELTDDQHRELATLLHSVKGMVIISGYPCDLYDKELYPNWKRIERQHLADGARKRTEVIWLNQNCVDGLRQMSFPMEETQ
ncbi:MAG TPA: DNA adenine methylase [Candidatus Angelobacter sp.]|jgi:DNA adenine methylase|nr:DNA adenine methylase [Candidatus Angelobacter sp.]